MEGLFAIFLYIVIIYVGIQLLFVFMNVIMSLMGATIVIIGVAFEVLISAMCFIVVGPVQLVNKLIRKRNKKVRYNRRRKYYMDPETEGDNISPEEFEMEALEDKYYTKHLSKNPVWKIFAGKIKSLLQRMISSVVDLFREDEKKN